MQCRDVRRTIVVELLAGEAGGDGFLAGAEEDGDGDGNVDVESEDVGFDGRAEAQRGFQVGDSRQHSAALLRGRRPHERAHRPEHVRAHAQLQRVPWALLRLLLLLLRLARGRARTPRRRRLHQDGRDQD